jgi:hypothetical protein
MFIVGCQTYIHSLVGMGYFAFDKSLKDMIIHPKLGDLDCFVHGDSIKDY